MKYTGIVRRLDSLGRIVIPREYRKMHKIKESDPLEIIAMDNGEIVIRKVDLSQELITLGTDMIKELSEATNLTVMLSDMEKFLTGFGAQKNSYSETGLSPKTQTALNSRKSFKGQGNEIGMPDCPYLACAPVFLEDVFGGIFLISSSPISLEDEKLLKIIAKILGGQMQKY